jgi:hypothetical protein
VMHQRFAPRALRVGLLAFGERQEV